MDILYHVMSAYILVIAGMKSSVMRMCIQVGH